MSCPLCFNNDREVRCDVCELPVKIGEKAHAYWKGVIVVTVHADCASNCSDHGKKR